MKYGRLSDIVFINTPAVACEKLCDSLHRKLSMSIQFLLESLVGSVILGEKP